MKKAKVATRSTGVSKETGEELYKVVDENGSPIYLGEGTSKSHAELLMENSMYGVAVVKSNELGQDEE